MGRVLLKQARQVGGKDVQSCGDRRASSRAEIGAVLNVDLQVARDLERKTWYDVYPPAFSDIWGRWGEALDDRKV